MNSAHNVLARHINPAADAKAYAISSRLASYYRRGEAKAAADQFAPAASRRDWATRAQAEEKAAARCALRIQAAFAF